MGTNLISDRGNDNWLIKCVRPDKEPEVGCLIHYLEFFESSVFSQIFVRKLIARRFDKTNALLIKKYFGRLSSSNIN